MTPSRLLLAAAGVALAVSLFLPWFDGVSGWEHWVWADVVLIVLAADLVAAAFTPPHVVHRVLVAIFCGLGVAVMLGHGFEPRVDADEPLTTVRVGAYLALGALAAGFVAALAPWPGRAARLLLVGAAGGIVAALLSDWAGGRTRYDLEDGGYSEFVRSYPDGFARWHVLDVALVALAVMLLVLAILGTRLPARVRTLLSAAAFAGCLLAAACVLVANDGWMWGSGFRWAWGLPPGTLAALLALFAGAAGLVLLRPRTGSQPKP
jgi:hypothetical protein